MKTSRSIDVQIEVDGRIAIHDGPKSCAKVGDRLRMYLQLAREEARAHAVEEQRGQVFFAVRFLALMRYAQLEITADRRLALIVFAVP